MKYLIIVLIRRVMTVFFIFPIKKNRIMFTSYNGKSISCNPKYIFNEINRRKNNGDLEIIWALNDLTNNAEVNDAKTVKYKSLKYIYLVLTSNVVVENTESWSVLPRRKKQVVINTWHGGGAYKSVGINRKDASDYNYKNVKYKNKRISTYISSSKAFTELTLRSSFLFDGNILEHGMPRNDILINQDKVMNKEIRKSLGVLDANIVLIAPTFRTKEKHDYLDINFKDLHNTFASKFGGDWVFLYRTHYYDNVSIDDDTVIIDVSEYPDMQELLSISDVLLTDYSSCMWDFSLMKKPVFLYAKDVDNYNNEEREFYTPISSWPFSFANNVNELKNNIYSFDYEEYSRKVSNHHKELGSYETGKASVYTVDYIQEIIGNGEATNVDRY